MTPLDMATQTMMTAMVAQRTAQVNEVSRDSVKAVPAAPRIAAEAPARRRPRILARRHARFARRAAH